MKDSGTHSAASAAQSSGFKDATASHLGTFMNTLYLLSKCNLESYDRSHVKDCQKKGLAHLDAIDLWTLKDIRRRHLLIHPEYTAQRTCAHPARARRVNERDGTVTVFCDVCCFEIKTDPIYVHKDFLIKYVMPFGRNRGKLMGKLRQSYLKWLCDCDNIRIAKIARELII